jgi:amylosucrase
MALYANRFAKNIDGVTEKIPYLEELGVNLVHLMPIMKCPTGASDGGYAVSDFRIPDPRSGTVDSLLNLSRKLDKKGMLLTLDVVLNHTSNEHEWARKAIDGQKKYEDYYYVFDTKAEVLQFEETMPEIFPETSPGSFTFNETMKKWIMTVFHDYQWDLNYRNPQVLIEMVDIILYYANLGADILRLDAVAFLWKKIGTTCQNLNEAHLILQLIRACTEVTAPGVIFIAEAIVAPQEVIKYFGDGGITGNRECDIAYNATFMALLWDGVATKNARLLNRGIKSLPKKPDGTTWLNYLRCHDDIGLGFNNEDISLAGYNVEAHRKFLLDYYTGSHKSSAAKGLTFGENPKTGDARIAGTLASLTGLDEFSTNLNTLDVDLRTDQIIMLHSLIFAFEGIPLLYYGDELATTNDLSYEKDMTMIHDSRWAHRPLIDWERAKLRKKKGTVEHKIFTALKKLIGIRKKLSLFKDGNHHIGPLNTDNDHILCWLRTKAGKDPEGFFKGGSLKNSVLIVSNFAATGQHVTIPALLNTSSESKVNEPEIRDLYSGMTPEIVNGKLLVAPFSFLWLTQLSI